MQCLAGKLCILVFKWVQVNRADTYHPPKHFCRPSTPPHGIGKKSPMLWHGLQTARTRIQLSIHGTRWKSMPWQVRAVLVTWEGPIQCLCECACVFACTRTPYVFETDGTIKTKSINSSSFDFKANRLASYVLFWFCCLETAAHPHAYTHTPWTLDSQSHNRSICLCFSYPHTVCLPPLCKFLSSYNIRFFFIFFYWSWPPFYNRTCVVLMDCFLHSSDDGKRRGCPSFVYENVCVGAWVCVCQKDAC